MTTGQNKRVHDSSARLAGCANALAEIFYRELFLRDPGLRELFKADLAKKAARVHQYGHYGTHQTQPAVERSAYLCHRRRAWDVPQDSRRG